MARLRGMNLGRVFAHAFVRRIVYALLGALLLWLGGGKAQAQAVDCRDAYSRCSYEQALAQVNEWIAGPTGQFYAPCSVYDSAPGAPQGVLYAQCVNGNNQGWSYVREASCKTTDAPLANRSAVGNSICEKGCKYTADVSVDPTVIFPATAQTFAKVWRATGEQCQTPVESKSYDPNRPICRTVGSQGALECIKPNGDHCITFANGSRHCWGPGQEGPRNDADGRNASDRRKAPGAPTAPTNIKDPTTTSTNTTTINNNTYNTSTFSGGGNSGGQGDTGTGGRDNGAGGDGGDGGDGVPGDGGDGGDDEGEQGQASGGTCGAGWTCSGDAIQCAVLSEAHKQRCALEGDGNNDLTGDEEGMGDGIGDLFGGEGGGGSVLDVLGDRLAGAPACPQDPEVSAFGKSIKLPLSKVCPYLQLVGTLFLAFAYLFAVKVMLE